MIKQKYIDTYFIYAIDKTRNTELDGILVSIVIKLDSESIMIINKFVLEFSIK